MGNQYSYYQTECENKTQFVFGTDQTEVDREFDTSEPHSPIRVEEIVSQPEKALEAETEKEEATHKNKRKDENECEQNELSSIYVIEYDNEISYFTLVNDLDDTILDVCISLRKLHMDEMFEGLFDFVINSNGEDIKIQMFKKGFNFLNSIDSLLHSVKFTKTNSYFIPKQGCQIKKRN